MGTLTTTLTLASTDISSDAISFSVTDALSTGQDLRTLSRVVVSNVGANNIIQPRTDGQTYYLFVKHTGTSDGSAAVTTTLNLGAQESQGSGTIEAGFEYFTRGLLKKVGIVKGTTGEVKYVKTYKRFFV